MLLNIWSYSKVGYYPPRTSRFYKWHFFKIRNHYRFIHFDYPNRCESSERIKELIKDIGILEIGGLEYYGSIQLVTYDYDTTYFVNYELV